MAHDGSHQRAEAMADDNNRGRVVFSSTDYPALDLIAVGIEVRRLNVRGHNVTKPPSQLRLQGIPEERADSIAVQQIKCSHYLTRYCPEVIAVKQLD